ncbi:hypothetical protein L861_19830 [Litchfieldella anticariensis FP35 = DSM 16096]|uniref:Uncharacterized protein n=1 Tax=Litchfieldella anticariensis (strain DSM 16096 / CECT 5854 / CIP 108499 / LMG 22089 / FP35) TaxID=1121939 RepID=S2KN59_LITA3|nr:hypothetical protein [Halomonas anticariensis]EPC01903.1 hypothetical protein L861_19830 [Halomonas anticariensis FP35 = DSM 16096]
MPKPTRPHYLATILLIIQREQERLNEIIPKISTRELTLEQLRELRSEWPGSLSMIDVHQWVLGGLDNLVDEYERGRVYKSSLRGLARQLEAYESGTRSYLAEHDHPCSAFLNQRGKVLARYQQAFERIYEPNGPLPHELQASIVRHLRDGYDLPRMEPRTEGEGWMLVFDQARPRVESQVVDIALARKHRNPSPC